MGVVVAGVGWGGGTAVITHSAVLWDTGQRRCKCSEKTGRERGKREGCVTAPDGRPQRYKSNIYV